MNPSDLELENKRLRVGLQYIYSLRYSFEPALELLPPSTPKEVLARLSRPFYVAKQVIDGGSVTEEVAPMVEPLSKEVFDHVQNVLATGADLTVEDVRVAMIRFMRERTG